MKSIDNLIILIMIVISCFLFGILMYLIGWSSYHSILGVLLMLTIAGVIIDIKIEIIDRWGEK